MMTPHYKSAALFALLLTSGAIRAQQLTLTPLLHSIGYRVLLPAGYDSDSTAFTVVRYRIEGQDWQPGFPASRLSIDEFQGSLFQLQPNVPYELEVSLVDSFPVFQKDVLTATTRTLAVPNVGPDGASRRWVSPTGSGTDYSFDHPGNLKTLLASGLACGTTVLLKGGVYALGDMALHLTQDCPENQPITIMAAPGETPILDGGSYDTYTWYKGDGDTTIWWTNLPPSLAFNALCIVDGERMYPYPFLTPNNCLTNYPSLWTLGFDLSGFYRDRFNRVFIKTLDGRNINHSKVIFSREPYCLTVYGNHKNVRLRIKGIHFKHYGKGRCDMVGDIPTNCYPSTALLFKDANHVVVDSCSFDFCTFPILFSGDCNHNMVSRCRVDDNIGYWSHAAIKGTADIFPNLVTNVACDPDFGSRGRYLENVGIHFVPENGQTVKGNMVWANDVQGTATGIGLGTNIRSAIMEESDIYQNRVVWCFDGTGAIGGHRNVRIWGNDISYCPIGTSLIASEQKPVYIFRNVYHHLDQRKNYLADINFQDCDNKSTEESWSTALKLNAGSDANANDMIYFIHNTVHSTEPYAFSLYLWAPTWKTLQLRNNIFYAEGYANFFFDQVRNQPSYSFESLRDNVVNPASSGLLGIVRPDGNYCLKYKQVQSLQAVLRVITGSSRVFWERTLNELPHFVDSNKGDFRLSNTSPLIDQGVLVPGFNHQFTGAAPDLGAFENETVAVRPTPKPDGGLAIFPNPAEDAFFVRFFATGGVALLQAWDTQGKLMAEQRLADLPSGSQTVRVEASAWPPGVYVVTLQSSDGMTIGRWIKSR
jgi:hypothetical protein